MTSQFSVLLRQWRRETELTQEDLAERTGLSVRTIRRLETGDRANPQMDTVRLLADGLGLGPDERARMVAVVDGSGVSDPVGGGNPVSNPGANTVSGPVEVEAVRPESAFERRLAEAADDLAHAVGADLGRDEELRRIQDPFPLPVRWQLAPDEVMDHWENICRVSPGASAAALDLGGRLPEIAEVHRRIPSGRLVVLGRGGSGKSVLAARFALDLLRTRERGGAVPVVLGLGSWDPTTAGFRDWLAAQLVRDHPGLAAVGRDEVDLATALVDAGRVLPVLDGFDEIASGLHRAALDGLNATTLPLLVTSRPGEYAAVARSDALTGAAAVRLTDLTVTDLLDYLPRTTRKSDGATAWDPVLAELRDHPERPACVNLRAVLTTPLMVGLARATHSGPGGGDPSVLLDTERFGSQHAIEDHLLGSFIPTVYREPDARWDPERVRDWLGYLAQHLDVLGTHDLAWWQLGGSMSRGRRMVVLGVVAGLAVGLLSALLIGVMGSPLAGRGAVPALVIGLENWLGFGLAFALGHGAGLTMEGGPFPPLRVRLRTRGGVRRLRTRFGPRFLAGLAGGLGVAPILGLANAAGHNPLGIVGVGFVGGLVTGVAMGALTGIAWALLSGLEAPVDIRSAVGPRELLRTNRLMVVIGFVGWGLVLGLAHSLMLTVALGHFEPAVLWFDLLIGPVIGLAIATCVTAWGQWLVFVRLWLPLTGRLPWAVADFLDDACRRGVLRQVGAVHQFRHARLQAHLSTG